MLSLRTPNRNIFVTKSLLPTIRRRELSWNAWGLVDVFFSVCSEVVQELTIKWKSSIYQVFADAEVALRLNENSFKARLYKAKAHQELEELEEFQESKKELDEMFPQHADLIEYFLKKEENVSDEEEDWILFCLVCTRGEFTYFFFDIVPSIRIFLE